MKKKILHIVEAFGGGIFSFLVDLINNTSDEYEIVVAYAMREQTPENFEEKFSLNVRFVRVQNFVRSISIKKDIQAFIEIKKIIKEEKPQIIHLHSSKAGFLGRMATIGNNVKVLYNPHGFSFLMQDCSRFKRYIYWLVEKIGTIKKSIIIGCSMGEFKEAKKISKNSMCINNGINIDEIEDIVKEQKKKEICFDEIKICTSGRVCNQKNPKLFNKIALENPQYSFKWIGDGELRNELTAPNIVVTGWKCREDVIRIVNECDVFLLTSLWEGLPISLLEAMFLGKNCYVTKCIGNSDVIENGENGFLINDSIDFSKMNKKDYFKISNSARETVYREYNIKKMIKEYKDIYSEL